MATCFKMYMFYFIQWMNRLLDLIVENQVWVFKTLVKGTYSKKIQLLFEIKCYRTVGKIF